MTADVAPILPFDSANLVSPHRMALPPELPSIGIVGCGTIGRGIALRAAAAGCCLKLFDAAPQAAAAAAAAAEASGATAFAGDIRRAARTAPVGGAVSICRDIGDVADCDLVIEATPEDAASKRRVLGLLGERLAPGAILGTTTSSLSVLRLSQAVACPERFCGLHVCHPVERRRLVEIVPAREDAAAQRGEELMAALGFAPLQVADSPGFVLNRLLTVYLGSALELLLEGAEFEELNREAQQFGMPCGPFEQIDEFGIDVALAVGRSLYLEHPQRLTPSPLLVAMEKAGRLGVKTGAGFCVATSDGGVQLDPEVQRLLDLRRRRRGGGATPRAGEVRIRLWLPMLLEALRMLDERLVAHGDVIDFVLREGLGLAANAPGLLGWGDAVGTPALRRWCGDLVRHGPRFEPPQSLVDAAHAGTPLRFLVDVAPRRRSA